LIVVGAETPSLAQAQRPSFYAGGDVVSMEQKNKDQFGILSGTAKTVNLRLKGGIHALDWLDAEVQFIVPQTGTYSTSGSYVTFKTSVFAVFAKPNTNLGPVNVYGLAGFAQISSDVTTQGGILSGTAKRSTNAFGVGAQYPVAKELSISADYVKYVDNVDFGGNLRNDISAIGIGVSYTFK